MWAFGSFGWNDVAMYGISIIGIIAIIVLGQRDFQHKKLVIPLIFIGSALIATFASAAIKPDVIGALLSRAFIFEFANIYITWRFFNDSKETK